MGLPIWNYSDGDEQKLDKATKDCTKTDTDPTAAARSVIRRRPSVHGRRNNHNHNQHVGASSRVRSSNTYRDSTASQNIPSVPDSIPQDGHNAQSTVRLHNGTLTIGHRAVHSSNYHDAIAQEEAPDGPISVAMHRYDLRDEGRRESALRAVRQSTFMEHRRRHRDAAVVDFLSHRYQGSHSSSRSRDDAIPRTNIPTPPLDTSTRPASDDVLQRDNVTSSPHLASIFRAVSPNDGLGDRRRSPSPTGDHWQIMRATITSDDSLPSTSSSFTTAAAATESFHRTDDHDAEYTATSDYEQGRDLSFDETMREMGIEVSSQPDSASSSSEDDDDDDDVPSNPNSAHHRAAPHVPEEPHSQRGRIAMRLYELAMSTPEGRRQIESLLHQPRPSHRQITAAPLSEEPDRMARDPHTLLTPLSHSGEDDTGLMSLPLPDPEPERFDNEIRSRSQEATSRTRAFFSGTPQAAQFRRWEETQRSRRLRANDAPREQDNLPAAPSSRHEIEAPAELSRAGESSRLSEQRRSGNA